MDSVIAIEQCHSQFSESLNHFFDDIRKNFLPKLPQGLREEFWGDSNAVRDTLCSYDRMTGLRNHMTKQALKDMVFKASMNSPQRFDWQALDRMKKDKAIQMTATVFERICRPGGLRLQPEPQRYQPGPESIQMTLANATQPQSEQNTHIESIVRSESVPLDEFPNPMTTGPAQPASVRTNNRPLADRIHAELEPQVPRELRNTLWADAEAVKKTLTDVVWDLLRNN